jgi:hypothetical protein
MTFFQRLFWKVKFKSEIYENFINENQYIAKLTYKNWLTGEIEFHFMTYINFMEYTEDKPSYINKVFKDGLWM